MFVVSNEETKFYSGKNNSTTKVSSIVSLYFNYGNKVETKIVEDNEYNTVLFNKLVNLLEIPLKGPIDRTENDLFFVSTVRKDLIYIITCGGLMIGKHSNNNKKYLKVEFLIRDNVPTLYYSIIGGIPVKNINKTFKTIYTKNDSIYHMPSRMVLNLNLHDETIEHMVKLNSGLPVNCKICNKGNFINIENNILKMKLVKSFENGKPIYKYLTFDISKYLINYLIVDNKLLYFYCDDMNLNEAMVHNSRNNKVIKYYIGKNELIYSN